MTAEPTGWPDGWPDWRTAYAKTSVLSARDLIEAGEMIAKAGLDVSFDDFSRTAEVFRRGYAALAHSLTRVETNR